MFKIDGVEQIKVFKEFIDNTYKNVLLRKIREGEKFIVIDFSDLSKYNHELADELLENPEDVINGGELALQEFDLPENLKNFKIRFKNIPSTETIKISNVRSENIGKFISMVGIIKQKSDVLPMVTAIRYECPNCGNIINVLQLDSKLREPTKCGCGRKGKFRLLSKELVDMQSINLEEAPEDLEGNEQPRKKNVLLKGDLISPFNEKRFNPGDKVMINGMIKEVAIMLRSGEKSTKFNLLFEANYIELVGDEKESSEITEKDIERIKKLSKEPNLYKKLTMSIAPHIFGYYEIKNGLLFQLVDGVKKVKKLGNKEISIRKNIHVLLIGDPSAGKSQLLKFIEEIIPKARYVSGTGTSPAGISAGVEKDELMGGWVLSVGALILSNGSICCFDELEKAKEETLRNLHVSMEQGIIVITKIIQATLKAEVSILAAANPVYSRFDEYASVAKQIGLEPTLISRFDLIFPMKDIPDIKKDDELAGFILETHMDMSKRKEAINLDLFKKYISYAKKMEPKLTKTATDKLRKYFVNLRDKATKDTIPITVRQLEGLIRLSEASCKLRLGNTVGVDDCNRAIELYEYSMKQIGMSEEMDVDEIEVGMSSKTRKRTHFLDVLKEKTDKTKNIEVGEIVKIGVEKFGMTESEVEEFIEKLKTAGEVYEPRRGFIAIIK